MRRPGRGTVAAGFGEDLDAREAGTIVFGGKRIAIDPHLADSRLRWQASSGEAVDIKLAASRAGRRARERLKLQSELFRVVGQGRKLSLAQDHAAAVSFRRRADAKHSILYRDDLGFSLIASWASRICGRSITKFFCATENPLAMILTW